MSSQKGGRAAADLPPGTLVELFFGAVDRFGDHAAFRCFPSSGPELSDISYLEAYKRAQWVALGLEAVGLRRGDRAAILSEDRPEWSLADYGCLCAGVVDVPVYSTLVAAQVAYILGDSGAKLVFVSTREQMEKAQEAARQLGRELMIVVFDDSVIERMKQERSEPPAGVLRWSQLLAKGAEQQSALGKKTGSVNAVDDAFRAAARTAKPDDVATILYTSGTTGQPKGVMLTHNNLHSNVVATGMIIEVTEQDSSLTFLPLSHVLQRLADYLLFSRGCTITYAHDLTTVAADLKIVRPTLAVSVPRLYEKVYNKVTEAGGLKGRIAQWALEVGSSWAEAKLAGREPTLATRMAHGVADRLVFKKIRAGVGGRLRFFVSGGAPLEPAIGKFFYAAGILILEGYGLTETSPVTNLNTPDAFKIGTVGRAVPGTEIRIDPDGEVLIRGPQVMKGYYNLPEETAKAIEPDGWFHTGDIGELDADGFLRITDRKKDLIVTAGGKKVAPQPIENRLKTSPFVDQLVMIGDRRKFPALLVVPAFDQLEAWARERGIAAPDRAALLTRPEVQGMLEREILGGLDDLASYERPKKLALLEEEFTVENGTLTPTQKVKRRVVQERFKHVIDAFYDEENEERAVFAASEVLAGTEA
jgi:long-chain acyl-CoA synthetase